MSDLFFLLILFVQIATLLMCCWQYWVARKVSMEYSESQWISFVVLSVLQVSIIVVPLTFMNTSGNALFFIFLIKYLVVSWSVLGFLFLPKIRYFYHRHERNSGKESASTAGVKGGVLQGSQTGAKFIVQPRTQVPSDGEEAKTSL